MIKKSGFVKALVDGSWVTKYKVYVLTGDNCAIDDDGDDMIIITEGNSFNCAILNDKDTWKYCDKRGNLINEQGE